MIGNRGDAERALGNGKPLRGPRSRERRDSDDLSDACDAAGAEQTGACCVAVIGRARRGGCLAAVRARERIGRRQCGEHEQQADSKQAVHEAIMSQDADCRRASAESD